VKKFLIALCCLASGAVMAVESMVNNNNLIFKKLIEQKELLQNNEDIMEKRIAFEDCNVNLIGPLKNPAIQDACVLYNKLVDDFRKNSSKLTGDQFADLFKRMSKIVNDRIQVALDHEVFGPTHEQLSIQFQVIERNLELLAEMSNLKTTELQYCDVIFLTDNLFYFYNNVENESREYNKMIGELIVDPSQLEDKVCFLREISRPLLNSIPLRINKN
jgi:hypothetical protein